MSVITLLTDFGSNSWYQSEMKGVIKKIAPKVDIIDITHNIDPFNIDQTILIAASVYGYFPKGTIHVIVVDPGVGSSRKPIIVKTEDYYFVAPDNGTLEWIFKHEKIHDVVEIENSDFFNHPVSNTFHGRDIFAPAAAHLWKKESIRNFGNSVKSPVRKKDFYPLKKDNNSIIGKIISTDNFGNLITNIYYTDINKNDAIRICIKTDSKNLLDVPFLRYYSQSDKGNFVALFGSSGFLEISIRESSAEEKSPLKKGDTVEVEIKNQK